MWCTRGISTQEDTHANMHLACHVRDAMSDIVGGVVKCVVHGDFRVDRVEWTYEHDAPRIRFSENRLEAFDVPPGAYTVCAFDATNASIVAQLVVEWMNIPTVVGYTVTHATQDTSRDGEIMAVVRNTDDKQVQYLWTGGIITDEPILKDARPGTYTATPIHAGNAMFLHACDPAVVMPSRHPKGDVSRHNKHR